MTMIRRMLLALAMTATAFAGGDVIEMKNGDRISGTIVKFEGEILIIDTPYAEKLKLDWAQVATINSESPHIVRLKSDQFVTARLVKAPGGMQLESEDLRSARTITPDEIASIDVPPGAQWEGLVAASLGGTYGNYPRNFAVGGRGEVLRRTDDDRLRLGIQGEHSDTQTADKVENSQGEQIGVKVNSRETTASNVRGWGIYDYNFDAHWSVTGLARLEHDRIQDLNLRTIVSAGPRYRFFDTKTEHFSVYLGGAYINENFIDPETEDRDFVSLALGDEFRWKFPWGLTLAQGLDIYPNLEDTSDILFNFYFNPRYAIMNGLFVGLNFNWIYDTLPAKFHEKSDFRYLANFGYEF